MLLVETCLGWATSVIDHAWRSLVQTTDHWHSISYLSVSIVLVSILTFYRKDFIAITLGLKYRHQLTASPMTIEVNPQTSSDSSVKSLKLAKSDSGCYGKKRKFSWLTLLTQYFRGLKAKRARSRRTTVGCDQAICESKEISRNATS